jgi:hypothetical protein
VAEARIARAADGQRRDDPVCFPAMDIVVIAIALIAALLATRERALAIAAVAWVAGVLMVAVGPAHNSDVHTGSAGFWGPWLIVGALCVAVVYGVSALRGRRSVQA